MPWRFMPAPPLLGPGLVTRRLSVARRDVVYVRSVLEASDGVAVMFAESGGELILAAPRSRLAELNRIVTDIKFEFRSEGRMCETDESAGCEGANPPSGTSGSS